MKTRYKIIIIIAALFVFFGIAGAFLIKNLFYKKDIQPENYYTRAEAEYMLEAVCEQEEVIDPDMAESKDGFCVADAKQTLGKLLDMSEEEVQEFCKEQGSTASEARTSDDTASETQLDEIDNNDFDLGFLHKSKDSRILSKREFLSFYDFLISKLGDTSVQKISIMVLDMAQEQEEEANKYKIISDDCDYILNGYSDDKNTYMQGLIQEKIDRTIQAYVHDGNIIEYLGNGTDAVVLENVWIESIENQELNIFIHGYHKTLDCNLSGDMMDSSYNQKLADIRIINDKVTDIVLKVDVITAKVLSVSEDGVEIEGYGTLGLSDHYRIYKIYGELAVEPTSQILVGYKTTNFVVADGVIEAALITEPIKAENIRVVLRNSDYTSLTHDIVKVTSEEPFSIEFQDQKKSFEAGETLELSETCGYMAGGRVVISSEVENGKLQITSITRNGANPAYRGTIEVAPYIEGGLTIVNELSLEEYLYMVVPSEMPSSYGEVALSVQAICARAYAYSRMLDGSYAKYGAHLDDSTATQVYNTFGDSEEAILAVKETYGMVPTYDGEIIQTYFFSTSGGTTCTNSDVWDGEALPYLKDNLEGNITATADVEGELPDITELNDVDFSDEEKFRAFIDDCSSYHTYEEEYSLFRWQIVYSQEEMTAAIDKTLKSRYDMNQDKVLTLQPDGSYESQPISSVGKVEQINITARGKSGIVKEIQVVGSDATVLVTGQSNARALMTPENVVIKRQDGSESIGWSMIPSPFYYVTKNDNGEYVISGGGYGHGVGMSQNGTKALADRGYTVEEIIKHYYSDVEIMNIYQWDAGAD